MGEEKNVLRLPPAPEPDVVEDVRLLMEDLKIAIRLDLERHELLLRNIHESLKLDGRFDSMRSSGYAARLQNSAGSSSPWRRSSELHATSTDAGWRSSHIDDAAHKDAAAGVDAQLHNSLHSKLSTPPVLPTWLEDKGIRQAAQSSEQRDRSKQSSATWFRPYVSEDRQAASSQASEARLEAQTKQWPTCSSGRISLEGASSPSSSTAEIPMQKEMTRTSKGSLCSSGSSPKRGRSKKRQRFVQSQGSVMESLASVGTMDEGKDMVKKPRWQAFAGIFFRVFGVAVVLLDAVLVTIEANKVAEHGLERPLHGPTQIMKLCLAIWYVFEIVFGAMWVGSCVTFFRGKRAAWHCMELSLTVGSVVDVIPGPHRSASGILRVLRLVRLARLLKILRPLRVYNIMGEFHKLVLCLASSLQTLAPAIGLITFVIFCIAVLFTEVVGEHLHHDKSMDDAMRSDLEHSFGSVADSMLSMYMAITAGRSWGEQFEMLEQVNPILSLFFVTFLIVIIYGLTNVVTAVFVESAMQASQSYRDLLVQRMLVKERVTVKHMKEIFRSIDVDGSGTITMDEMKLYMENDNFALQEYFEALDLSITDAESLFVLLDTDGSGNVDIEEFCDGCIRLGGPAKSFDINCMWHEQRRMNRMMLRFLQVAGVVLQGLARNPGDFDEFASLFKSVERAMQSAALREYGPGCSPAQSTCVTNEPSVVASTAAEEVMPVAEEVVATKVTQEEAVELTQEEPAPASKSAAVVWTPNMSSGHGATKRCTL